jgi:hypothetical protein
MFVGKPRKTFKVLHSRVAPLPSNIGLGWKVLPGTDTLAYYKLTLIKNAKCIKTLGLGIVFTALHFLLILRMGPINKCYVTPWANDIKLFMFIV